MIQRILSLLILASVLRSSSTASYVRRDSKRASSTIRKTAIDTEITGGISNIAAVGKLVEAQAESAVASSKAATDTSTVKASAKLDASPFLSIEAGAKPVIQAAKSASGTSSIISSDLLNGGGAAATTTTETTRATSTTSASSTKVAASSTSATTTTAAATTSTTAASTSSTKAVSTSSSTASTTTVKVISTFGTNPGTATTLATDGNSPASTTTTVKVISTFGTNPGTTTSSATDTSKRCTSYENFTSFGDCASYPNEVCLSSSGQCSTWNSASQSCQTTINWKAYCRCTNSIWKCDPRPDCPMCACTDQNVAPSSYCSIAGQTCSSTTGKSCYCSSSAWVCS